MNLFERVYEYLSFGGFVMFLIFVLSLFLWSLILEKFLVLRKEKFDSDEIVSLLRGKDIKNLKGTGPKTKLILDFLKNRSGTEKIDESILDMISKREKMELEKDIPIIMTLSAIAPLLGLLGTVCGMIKVFFAITIFGTGNAKAIAAGISEALITTQGGLVVAIPGLYMGNILKKRAKNLSSEIDQIVLIIKEGYKSQNDKS